MRAADHPENDARLKTLATYDIMDTPSESDFDDIAALASYICDAPISLVSLIDHDRQWFKARKGTDETHTTIDTSICSHALLNDDLLEISDLRDDVRTSDNHLIKDHFGMRFYAGMPLIAPNGLPIGTLCVLSDQPKVLTHDQRKALRTLARQVMQQLELRQALRNQETLRREMDHRVKNSLQTVQSLIRLYAAKITDGDAQTAFAAIDRRLNAIVALHRELHQSSSNERINMKPFLGGILGHLDHTLPDAVVLKTNVADMQLSSTEATTIAVVASECVANAIKHAFPDGRAGEIEISCNFDVDGLVVLTSHDNGVGTNHAKASNGGPIETLGSRIMEASAMQIGASLSHSAHADGYSVTMTFQPASS
jgi:two-component sensor histidine kinase